MRTLRRPIDCGARGADFSRRSKLTGKVMSKGKGNGSLFRIRCRSFVAPDRPVQTRLTRTMGFVEVSRSPCMPGSAGAASDEGLESEDLTANSH
jgi:hypothetical protein